MLPDEQAQLLYYIQTLQQLLLNYTSDKNAYHQHNGTMDSMLTCLSSEEQLHNNYRSYLDQAQFYHHTFNNEQTAKFHKFVQHVQKKFEEQNKQNISAYSLCGPKKAKFIVKTKTPKTVFNYHGIDIEVLYQKYDTFRASCLVLPYDKMDVKGLESLGLNGFMIANILQDYDSKSIETLEDNGEAIVVNSYRLFKGHNYRWLYLTKKPEYKYMPEYSADRLQNMVIEIIQKCWRYKTTDSIAFPDFEWKGLDGPKKCQIFFWTLLKHIYSQLSLRSTSINKITVCCQKQSSFFQFTYKLRQISDAYVRNGLIPISIR